MIELKTFTDKGDKVLDFHFNNPKIEYQEKTKWVNIFAAKQKLTIYKNSFIAYDDSIQCSWIDLLDMALSKDWIESIYKQNKKILLLSTTSDEPLYIFYGNTLSITYIQDDYIEFLIENKKLVINNLHWLILTKNTAL